MSFTSWSTFATAILALALLPGPSTLLVTSVAVRHGPAAAGRTILGDLAANACQMALACLGVAALVRGHESSLGWVRIAGVSYLAGLGVWELSCSDTARRDSPGDRRPGVRHFLHGYLVAATNPKAVLFFAGFFPLFLDAGRPLFGQVLVLGATYVAIDGLGMGLYAFLGRRLAARLGESGRRASRRLAGAFYLGAAVVAATRSVS